MLSGWRSRYGFAQHINNNAERLRYQFVNRSSKTELKVVLEKLTDNRDWQQAVELWSKKIDQNVKTDIAALMVCDFSTTTPIIHTANQVVIMDALKQYFDYRLYGICGIPWIIVRGSVADWCKIRECVEIISEYDLDWWTKRLLPICDTPLVSALPIALLKRLLVNLIWNFGSTSVNPKEYMGER